jgi:hypothetical protein
MVMPVSSRMTHAIYGGCSMAKEQSEIMHLNITADNGKFFLKKLDEFARDYYSQLESLYTIFQ